MHRLLCALTLLFFAAPSYSAATLPFNLMMATKGSKSAYFMPTIHQSNDDMRKRMKETLRCLPEIGAVVTETSLADVNNFNLFHYSIAENKKLGHRLSPELVLQLDELSDKALPRGSPRKFASTANRAAIHPSHFLSTLKGRVDLYILMSRGWDLFGPSFESMLHAYAREKKISEIYLESVDAAAAAHIAIPPDQLAAQADYLLRLWNDKKMQYQMYIATDDMIELFKAGDWTSSNVQKLNAGLRAGQSDGYVSAVVVQRTKNMMARFDALPPQDKPILVAIGMGHFGNVDGVQAELIARGYTLRGRSGSCSPQAR